jgi:hypothetical protein
MRSEGRWIRPTRSTAPTEGRVVFPRDALDHKAPAGSFLAKAARSHFAAREGEFGGACKPQERMEILTRFPPQRVLMNGRSESSSGSPPRDSSAARRSKTLWTQTIRNNIKLA